MSVDLSDYPHLGDWEDWERPELEAAAHRRELARLQEGAEREQAEAARAPAIRRERERQARAQVRADVAALLAELCPSPVPSGRGRPSLIGNPAVRALFTRADAAGLTAPELAGLFGVSERTARAWRSQL